MTKRCPICGHKLDESGKCTNTENCKYQAWSNVKTYELPAWLYDSIVLPFDLNRIDNYQLFYQVHLGENQFYSMQKV